MKWITRANANVDRVACPWLIKRFVDPEAEFLFVPADQVMAAAKREQAIPYDVPNVELGHVDGCCSFESIVLKYNLKTVRAYLHREDFQRFWEYRSPYWAAGSSAVDMSTSAQRTVAPCRVAACTQGRTFAS